MKRERQLLKNFGILSVGNASVKMFSFLLIPLYTNILSTEDYGIYELVIVTVGLLIPIVTLDVADATLRFSMDDKINKNEVYRVSIKYCIIGTVIVVAMLFFNSYTRIVDFAVGKEIIIAGIFTVTALVNVLIGYAKGIGKVKETAISGVLGSLTTIAVNLVMLIPLKMGIRGFFIAYLTGIVSQLIYLEWALKGQHKNYWRARNKELEHSIIKYSSPLIANNVSWWVNSALDRYILTFFCGLSENGIYSLSYKIPTILNMVQSVFHQAWTISAIQEHDKDGAAKFFVSTYRMYNFTLIMICALIIVFNKAIAKIMYSKDFYQAWKYVPFLCIGFLFLGLANYIGGILNALKQTKVIAGTTLIAAVCNCVLNFLLIPWSGATGAAIATLCSYIVVWLARLELLRNKQGVSMFLSKDIISYSLLMIDTLDMLWDISWGDFLHILVLAALMVANWSELTSMVENCGRFVSKGKKHE